MVHFGADDLLTGAASYSNLMSLIRNAAAWAGGGRTEGIRLAGYPSSVYESLVFDFTEEVRPAAE